jgi:hypothetical protein
MLVPAATLFATLWSSASEAQVYPYPYPPYPPLYRGGHVAEGSVRIDATPREAEVYVNGYYAGIVDDFDGIFQRLHLRPGPHDITLYRDGYRSVTQKVYVPFDTTLKIKYQMEPLAPGEIAHARPSPPSSPLPEHAPLPVRARGPFGRTPPTRYPPQPGYPPPGYPPAEAPVAAGQSANGTISIRVQPADAAILVDGQPVPAGQETVIVDVAEGRHNIQVRKQGYIGYLTDVQVRRGEITTLNVTLRPQP